jgi:gamma-glutamyltranspeptidase/glutathione hydrolase
MLISIQSEFLEDSTVQQVRKLINDSTTYPAPYVNPFLPFDTLWKSRADIAQYDPSDYISSDDHGTSHMAAADQWGNAISLTTSKWQPPQASKQNPMSIVRRM